MPLREPIALRFARERLDVAIENRELLAAGINRAEHGDPVLSVRVRFSCDPLAWSFRDHRVIPGKPQRTYRRRRNGVDEIALDDVVVLQVREAFVDEVVQRDAKRLLRVASRVRARDLDRRVEIESAEARLAGAVSDIPPSPEVLRVRRVGRIRP